MQLLITDQRKVVFRNLRLVFFALVVAWSAIGIIMYFSPTFMYAVLTMVGAFVVLIIGMMFWVRWKYKDEYIQLKLITQKRKA